ncbi:hypothetical protein BJ742DRAFT_857931, partial [Cladochytrium replicatum]
MALSSLLPACAYASSLRILAVIQPVACHRISSRFYGTGAFRSEHNVTDDQSWLEKEMKKANERIAVAEAEILALRAEIERLKILSVRGRQQNSEQSGTVTIRIEVNEDNPERKAK